MEDQDPLTGAVIAAAIEVHRWMGPGVLESIYQACLEEEFKLRGIACLAQHRFPLVYKGKPLKDDFIIDFYFPQLLVVEIKAVEKIIPVHEAQLLSYLRLTNTRVGLLLNFRVPVLRDGIRRMVL